MTVCHQFCTVSTGFQYVSESPSRSLCSCRSVSMVLLLRTAGTLCPGRRRLSAVTATVCIYSMYSVTEVENVNGTAKFCVPWAVNLEQFATNSARILSNKYARGTNSIWVQMSASFMSLSNDTELMVSM